ncbi:type VI secretion system-associated protein TagF [Vibrio sp. JC009]|uniref:type VI secretion system-associated protein TagF n=1 Tax=Vibrio sp. JC009 TaxID=2912314 RepID=UPI0023B06CDD|nr:type VI secretion system-associated protein TagF [Vibrio sp. JC009]WED22937.1 type VI secretion system-associated protein TagF [Vibrio sp. JC009]
MSEAINKYRAKIGFFGKQPTYGDFLSRRLPNTFTSVWDRWLELAINESRQQLGNEWLNYYLTSPIWRFALPAGIAGDNGWAGVLMPSVDSVGRYFPFTLAMSLPSGTNLSALLSENEIWFNQCEEAALLTLHSDFNLEQFDKEISNIEEPRIVTSANPLTGAQPVMVHFELPSVDPFYSGISSLNGYLSSKLPDRHSLWWTHGSEKISPSLLIAHELPARQSYASMLDGNWELRGWQQYDLAHNGEPQAGQQPQAR